MNVPLLNQPNQSSNDVLELFIFNLSPEERLKAPLLSWLLTLRFYVLVPSLHQDASRGETFFVHWVVQSLIHDTLPLLSPLKR